MDRHEVPEEATPQDVALDHAKDVEIQAKYGVDYITYWFDHQSGAGFCLVEGPSVDVVEEVHREAHGQIAAKVMEVDRAVVEAFLGQLDRPVTGEPFVATAFREQQSPRLQTFDRRGLRRSDAGAVEHPAGRFLKLATARALEEMRASTASNVCNQRER